MKLRIYTRVCKTGYSNLDIPITGLYKKRSFKQNLQEVTMGKKLNLCLFLSQ